MIVHEFGLMEPGIHMRHDEGKRRWLKEIQRLDYNKTNKVQELLFIDQPDQGSFPIQRYTD